MQVVTPKQMNRIEERSEKLGVTKKQLMENAGKILADRIASYTANESDSAPEDTSVVFLAGSGNNGGDCFAAASILVYKGFKVTVVSLVKPPATELAKEMAEKLPERVALVKGYRSENVETALEAAELDYMTIHDEDINDLQKKKELTPVESIMLSEKKRMAAVRRAVSEADILVDGVFGTGFRGQLEKDIMSIFAISTGAYKIAVDVPTGGNSAVGTVSAGTFKADETITFGYMKVGLAQYPLRKFCGDITVADIGIPARALDILDGERKYLRTDRAQLAGFPRSRERDSHKGNFGTVLVIAGSSSMRGAAAFAVMGALRSGAGMVRLASVEKCIDTVAVLAPEATFIQLDEDDYGFMLFDDQNKAFTDAVEKASAIVIGCGMGVTNDTAAILRYVLENANCPVVIDADGINCIASDIDILVNKKTKAIITPHVGEMARLLSCENSMITDNRLVAAEKYAEKFGITVVLKGAGTVIADSKYTAVNHTGNPGMSRGGSGDILAGIIGSAVAQGYSCFDASCAAVYIHGLAGDAAADKLGQEGMLPRDIVDCIPDSFSILRKKQTDLAEQAQ